MAVSESRQEADDVGVVAVWPKAATLETSRDSLPDDNVPVRPHAQNYRLAASCKACFVPLLFRA